MGYSVVHGLSRIEKLHIKSDSGVDKTLKTYGFVRSTDSIVVSGYFAYVGRNMLFIHRARIISETTIVSENGSRFKNENVISLTRIVE